jgi:hypothetical protein
VLCYLWASTPAQSFPSRLTETLVAHIMSLIKKIDQEQRSREHFLHMQTEIHELFSTRPIPPVISVRGITQTSITIQWDPLQLFRADQLFTIEVFKNNQKLTVIPVGTSAKLTGLDVNQSYQVFIRCKTSAGLLKSNDLTVKTHSLDNLTGINVSFGEFPGGGGAEVDKLIDLVYKYAVIFAITVYIEWEQRIVKISLLITLI